MSITENVCTKFPNLRPIIQRFVEEGKKTPSMDTVTASLRLYDEYVAQMEACLEAVNVKQRHIEGQVAKTREVAAKVESMRSGKPDAHGIVRRADTGVYLEMLTLQASTKPERIEYLFEETDELLEALPDVVEVRRLLKVEVERRYTALRRARR